MKLGGISSAWYQREIEIPKEWGGRKVSISLEYLNSHAVVYVDGKSVGEIRFPGGEVDVSSVCQPGQKHVLSLLVTAMPLKGVVAGRGLCGDVYLIGRPAGARIEDVKVETSVRQGQISIAASVSKME